MSFFDEVETTVANTRYIQAQENNLPVQLNLPPFEELSAEDADLRADFIHVAQMLQPNTFRRYLFVKYLKQHGYGKICRWLEDVSSRFKAASHKQLPNVAKELFREYFTQGDLLVEDMEETPRSQHKTNKVAPLEAGAGEEEVEGSDVVPEINLASWLGEEEPKVLAKIKATLNTPDKITENLFAEAEAVVVKHWEKDSMMDRFKEDALWKTFVQLNKYKERTVSLDDFHVFRVLGRGAFGAVSVVQKNDTRALFAIKQMDKKMVKKNNSFDMCKFEKLVLSKMKKPQVLNLKYSFHDKDNLYLVFDMCPGGDLRFHLRDPENNKRLTFPPDRAQFYAAEVLLGLEHMHSFNIVYRDLKPNNILLDKAGHAKLSDMGLAIEVKEGQGAQCRHVAGTAGYWAPEILSKTGTYPMSDIWSWGVLLFEMHTGRIPKSNAKEGTKEWSPFTREDWEEDNARHPEGVCVLPTDDFHYSNPLVSEVPHLVDLLKKVFVQDPLKRIGANGYNEIKGHPYFENVEWAKLERYEVEPPFVPNSNQVYANSIAEVGEFNRRDYAKEKLTEEDERAYRNWDFTSEEGVQAELAEALNRLDNEDASDARSKKEDKLCCTIL